MVGELGEHAHRLVPLGLDAVLRLVDLGERRGELVLGLLLPRLILGGGVVQLLLLDAQPFFLAPQQLQPDAEQPHFLLVLHLPGRDRLALTLRELHLLLLQAELLVDAV